MNHLKCTNLKNNKVFYLPNYNTVSAEDLGEVEKMVEKWNLVVWMFNSYEQHKHFLKIQLEDGKVEYKEVPYFNLDEEGTEYNFEVIN